MEQNELVVLEKCQNLLNNFGLCSKTNGCTFGKKYKIWIPNWLIRFLYSIPTCTSIILAAWHIIDNNWNLAESAVAITVIVGGGQCQIIYFLLIGKNTSFVSVVDRLQKLVSKRKLYEH